jgi:hypothetical protein
MIVAAFGIGKMVQCHLVMGTSGQEGQSETCGSGESQLCCSARIEWGCLADSVVSVNYPHMATTEYVGVLPGNWVVGQWKRRRLGSMPSNFFDGVDWVGRSVQS